MDLEQFISTLEQFFNAVNFFNSLLICSVNTF